MLLARIADEFSTMARLPQGDMKRHSLRRYLEVVVGLHGKPEMGPTLVMEGDAHGPRRPRPNHPVVWQTL